MNFRKWFESDPGPQQMAPQSGPNPPQVPVDLPKSKMRFVKPLGNLTPNFPNNTRSFAKK